MSVQRDCVTCGKKFFISKPSAVSKIQNCSEACRKKFNLVRFFKKRAAEDLSTDPKIKIFPDSRHKSAKYLHVRIFGCPFFADGKSLKYSRVLVTLHLGRKLLPSEDVHHKNGNKQDDRLDNYELLDHRNHTILTHTGRKLSEEAKKKIGDGNRGKRCNEVTRKILSLRTKQYYAKRRANGQHSKNSNNSLS